MNRELKNYILFNFGYANHLNPNCEYSENELMIAKTALKPHLRKIKDLDEDLLYKVFACLIRSINNNKKDLDLIKESDFKKKSELWKQYHLMIFSFNRVMQSFYRDIEGSLAVGGKIFPISKVTFEGSKKEHKIVIEGEVLSFIKTMFLSWHDTYSKDDNKRMKDFSSDMHEAYVEFQGEWKILNANKEETLALQLKKNREEGKKETAFNKYKYQTAFQIHQYLKRVSKNENTKIPSWHCMLIGVIFENLGLDEYLDYNDNKKIGNWIERGSPEYTSRTKNPLN